MKRLIQLKLLRGGLLAAAALSLVSCQSVTKEAFHTWNGPEGGEMLVMSLHKDANCWLGPVNLSTPRIYVNEDGRTEIEVEVRNPIAIRRSAGYRWVWSDARGMTQRSLTSEAYHPLYVSPMGRKVIRSTSPFPNPKRVALHIHK